MRWWRARTWSWGLEAAIRGEISPAGSVANVRDADVRLWVAWRWDLGG